jgi:hypothetical protein
MDGGSFKSGAGSIDFEEDADDSDDPEQSQDSDSDTETPADTARDRGSGTSASPRGRSRPDSDADDTTSEKYPYFVRRNTVGEERDHRMELHVRPEIADGESDYRSDLAEALGTDEVAKTDAREAALKIAYQNPELAAEVMKDEGYGELE